MSLFGLEKWLGHKWAYSTEYYLKVSATRLVNSYRDAEYFARNVRAIEVLIDRQAIMTSSGARESWMFYDLGHGYCSYDFFDQCPHRMACAKCSFYVPKESTRAQLLEGKANLLRMRQEIPLKEVEIAAIDDGVIAFEKLLTQLADVPTPTGLTPRRRGQLHFRQRQHWKHLRAQRLYSGHSNHLPIQSPWSSSLRCIGQQLEGSIGRLVGPL